MDLFTNNLKQYAPLASRMRPTNLSEFIGQKHLIFKGSLLTGAIKNNWLGSSIFYGPPGTGKTTLAGIIASSSEAVFEKLNAVSSGVADAKKIIKQAKDRLSLYGKRTYLLLDECHRWSKAQSDSVLEAMEEGSIILIGSTTENPYVSMTKAILSRVKVYKFNPLTKADVSLAIKRAIEDKTNGLGNMPIEMSQEVISFLATKSGGDIRTALNALELAVGATGLNKNKKIIITKEIIAESVGSKMLGVDDDLFYNMLSAFCKSLRGSDPDSALYYSNRLIEGGIDPLIIARRLVVHASEDVGLADSNALVVATSALTALKNLGLPEGNIPLSHAIIYVCLAPKSNAVVKAMGKAIEDAKVNTDNAVPEYLKNNSPQKKNYKYPHEFGGYVKQQYLPNSLKDKIYYVPTKNGAEKDIKILKREK